MRFKRKIEIQNQETLNEMRAHTEPNEVGHTKAVK